MCIKTSSRADAQRHAWCFVSANISFSSTLFTSDKGGGTCFCPCLFVCLSVCLLARLLKNTCMDLDEMLRVDRCQDMDELINFWARSGLYSPDAGTGLLSPISHKRCYAEFYVEKISRRGFKMVLFTAPSEHLCRKYMRSTECPSSFACVSYISWRRESFTVNTERLKD